MHTLVLFLAHEIAAKQGHVTAAMCLTKLGRFYKNNIFLYLQKHLDVSGGRDPERDSSFRAKDYKTFLSLIYEFL
jgi:hypothetical protein